MGNPALKTRWLRAVRKDRELTPADKLVAADIANFVKGVGGVRCFRSVDATIEATGLARSTVQLARRRLRERGHLAVLPGPGGRGVAAEFVLVLDGSEKGLIFGPFSTGRRRRQTPAKHPVKGPKIGRQGLEVEKNLGPDASPNGHHPVSASPTSSDAHRTPETEPLGEGVSAIAGDAQRAANAERFRALRAQIAPEDRARRSEPAPGAPARETAI